MKIKKSSIDVFLILLLMLVIVFPLFIAKELVLLSVILIIIRVIISKNFFSYIKIKTTILMLFVPSIFSSLYFSPEDLLRYVGILLIVFGFPFSGFKFKYPPILILSSLIILYLTITQILLLQGNQLILNFRDFAYCFEGQDAHKNYGTTDNIFKNAFDFSYWKIRGGGLYCNPNLLAGIVLFYFFIFDITWSFQKQLMKVDKKKWKVFIYLLIFIATFSVLIQSKSKTFIIGFLVYLIIQNINFTSLVKLKLNKKFVILFFFTLIFLSLFIEQVIFGFSDGGSANIKYSILWNYLEYASIFNLLFGGTFNVWFDAEYGHWIGAAGLFGIVAFIIFYTIIFRFSLESRPLLVSFLFISIGSSLFYNLTFTAILIPLFIILLSNSKKVIE